MNFKLENLEIGRKEYKVQFLSNKYTLICEESKMLTQEYENADLPVFKKAATTIGEWKVLEVQY